MLSETTSLRFLGGVMSALLLACCSSAGEGHAAGSTELRIAFQPEPRLDLLEVSVRVLPTSHVRPDEANVRVSLIGLGGLYFDQTLTAGSLVANAEGDQWLYESARGGSSAIYRMVLREELNTGTNRREYRIEIRAESDLAATDPDQNPLLGEEELRTMTLQVVIGDEIFALTSAWERYGNGWKLNADRFPSASVPIPSGCEGIYVHDGSLSTWGDGIQQARSASFTFQFERSGGGSLSGYTVRLTQTKHRFPFGGTINYGAFTPGDEEIKARCLAQADELWNSVVDESRQKWKPSEPTAGAVDFSSSNQIVQWAQDHDKNLRHHTIFWSNPSQNPTWLDSLDASTFRQAMLDRVDYFTAGQCPPLASCVLPDPTLVTSVDVINEMIFWDYYRNKLGESDFSGIVKEIYDRVKANLPAAKLYLNEQPDHLCVFANLCDGLDFQETYEFVTSSYIQFVEDMQADGVAFDGLALQSHFSDPDLNNIPNGPTPAEIVAAYEQAMATAAATLGMPLLVSELDYATSEVCERADFLNRFYHMAFASDFVEGIFYWGWVVEPQKALLDADCELNPAGELVRYLVNEKWKTRLDHQSIATGEVSADLFFGDYEAEIFDASGQSVWTASLPLYADSKRTVAVMIP